MESNTIHNGECNYPKGSGMIFLLVLLLATAAAALASRRAGIRSWARNGMAAAFVVAGIGHLAQPLPFEQHLPGWVPGAAALVFVTGILEIALGAALALWRNRRQQVGRVIAAYLVAVFPANVYVAVAGIDVDGQPGGAYPWLRLPLQALFVVWVLWTTRPEAPRSERSAVSQVRHGGGVHSPAPAVRTP